MSDTIGKPFWHLYHDVLLSLANEPIENRIAWIKDTKPAHEVETRLQLLKPVKGDLPQPVLEAQKAVDDAQKALDDACKAVDDAQKALDDAWEAVDDAQKALDDAWKAVDHAIAQHADEINALHEAECPKCPWDDVLKTIFPAGATT